MRADQSVAGTTLFSGTLEDLRVACEAALPGTILDLHGGTVLQRVRCCGCSRAAYARCGIA